MSEKRFEDDGVEHNNNYNYALLDTYYEFDGERIIEWNKHSSNAEYTDFERIAEILNIKQMRLESLMKHREEIGKLFDRIDEQQTTINELQSIINHIKCEENCEDYDYCCETVCSLYNEIKHLKEENEQLKHYKLYEDNKRLQTIIADLKEENEQLRQILKDIVVATDETYTKNKSIYKVSVVFTNETYLKIRECLNE